MSSPRKRVFVAFAVLPGVIQTGKTGPPGDCDSENGGALVGVNFETARLLRRTGETREVARHIS